MSLKKNTELAINEKCDFCGSSLYLAYAVPESTRGAVVTVCNLCGLVQTIYSKINADRVVSPSSGAGWGNIRHGKELRFEQIKKLLLNKIPWEESTSVLDIGSNRGTLVHWVEEYYSKTSITAIEPDSSIVGSYHDFPNVTLYIDRLENIKLPKRKFDTAFCFHTLEHADSAAAMLKAIHSSLKLGGYLFLEVPNITTIVDSKRVEEFFIDKHKYHFNQKLLNEYLKFIGFSIVYGLDKNEGYNITIIAKKNNEMISKQFTKLKSTLVELNKKNISKYTVILQKNREKIKRVAAVLNSFMERQKVAFWGGGRIFDAIVQYGGLHTQKVYCLIDKYLAGKLPENNSVPIVDPNTIKFISPDVFVILANSSESEIYSEIRSYGYINIIKFRDLLENEL